jgi:ubiquinone/menaquinone biosynthesis C-methylase UbiE
VEQRFTFDQVASVYSKARPAYPDALVDDVVSYADLKPNDRIFEVGCGTGQATKSFAKRGFSILATDPGSEMLRGARESLAGFSNVEFLETTFEAWPADRAAFRLIIAAQSWHWVSPEVRFRKAADALSRDGSLAVFGHVPVGLPAPLLDQFKEIYLRQIGKWVRRPRLGTSQMAPQRVVYRVRFVRASRVQALLLEMAADGVKLCGLFTDQVGPPDDGASETRRAAG